MLLDWLARRQMAAFEKKFSYDMGYARELLSWSGKGFRQFIRVAAMANHRENVPLSTWFAVKLVGARAEDCGPCTQLVIDMARSAGVADQVLRAVLRNAISAMDADTSLGYRYALAVVERRTDVLELRDAVLERFGTKGMASLALTLTGSRMYPMLKYAMGHGHACVRVRVGAETLDTRRAAAVTVMNNPPHAANA